MKIGEHIDEKYVFRALSAGTFRSIYGHVSGHKKLNSELGRCHPDPACGSAVRLAVWIRHFANRTDRIWPPNGMMGDWLISEARIWRIYHPHCLCICTPGSPDRKLIRDTHHVLMTIVIDFLCIWLVPKRNGIGKMVVKYRENLGKMSDKGFEWVAVFRLNEYRELYSFCVFVWEGGWYW